MAEFSPKTSLIIGISLPSGELFSTFFFFFLTTVVDASADTGEVFLTFLTVVTTLIAVSHLESSGWPARTGMSPILWVDDRRSALGESSALQHMDEETGRTSTGIGVSLEVINVITFVVVEVEFDVEAELSMLDLKVEFDSDISLLSSDNSTLVELSDVNFDKDLLEMSPEEELILSEITPNLFSITIFDDSVEDLTSVDFPSSNIDSSALWFSSVVIFDTRLSFTVANSNL